MKYLKRIYTGFFLSLCIQLSAHEPVDGTGFIPNKGQWDSQVLYRISVPNGAMFLERGGFSYTFYDGTYLSALHNHQHTAESMPELVKTHTIRMKLAGADYQTAPIEENPSLTKYNYYIGNDPKQWASGLHAYRTVTYPEVYPRTDMKLYLNGAQVKYDFMLQPGADIRKIRMSYQGADQLQIKDGKLVIKTSLGEIVEQEPVAWQNEAGTKIPVQCRFILHPDGSVGFEADNLNPELELVLDPHIVFVTYSGSIDDNWGFTATNDNEGNGYAAGVVFGARFQTTAGAAQQSYGGGVGDIGIIKYNSTGTQALYITYIGGNRSEFPHSLIVNAYNELIMFGSTGSADFPVTSGAYSNVFKGGTSTGFSILSMPQGSDIFVCRLSVNGENLLASTLVGGTKNDGLNNGNNKDLVRNYADEIRGAVWVDEENNIYVGTSTLSNDFPGTTGRLQPDYGGGGQDGIILKMNGNLSKLLWATYLGGEASDGIFYLTVDRRQHIIVTGGTKSENFPVSSGAWQTSFGGGSQPDGFVSIIDSSGTQLIASSYVGTDQYDQSYIVGTDASNSIYLFGQTSSTGNRFVINSSIGITGGNQFITKFSSDLKSVEWSTTFGKALGKPDISPTALLVDYCDKIYASGWGGNLNGPFNSLIHGMLTTPDAIKLNTDGNDFYFYVINSNASQVEYASYFGGNSSRDHVDGGTSRFDRKGIIYQAICASCGGQNDLPVSPGAYSPTNNSSNCNNALVKFDFETPIVIAAFVLSDSTGHNIAAPIGCAPFGVTFKNSSINATEFSWIIDGQIVSTDKDLNHVFSNSGNYEVKLVATSSATCNISDTSTMTLRVLADIHGEVSDINACRGEVITLGPLGFEDPYYTFSWNPQFGLDNPSGRRPKVTATADTSYRLIIRMGVCQDTLYQKINLVGAETTLPALNICLGDSVLIGSSGTPPEGATFTWSPVTGLSATSSYTTQASPSETTVYRLLVQPANQNCPDTLTQKVQVGEGIHSTLPQLNACLDDSVKLGPTAPISGSYTYSWSPADNIGNTHLLNPFVFAQTSRDYRLLIEKNGCNDTLDQRLEVYGQHLPEPVSVIACKGDSLGIGLTEALADEQAVFAWNPTELVDNPASYYTHIVADQDRLFRLAVSWPIEGCKDTFTVAVNVKNPLANFGYLLNPDCDYLNVQLLDSSQQNTNMRWILQNGLISTEKNLQIQVAYSDTLYVMQVVSDDVCSDSMTLTEKMKPFSDYYKEQNVNVFSPDGDGLNDCFSPALQLGPSGVDETFVKCSTLQVFDRWGLEIFSSEKICWNGNNQAGNKMPDGVYFYRYSFRNTVKTGTVHLVRKD